MLTEIRPRSRAALPTCPRFRAIRLLALIAMCDADPRPDKIDVGVGVFRDGGGQHADPASVKEAEQRLVETQYQGLSRQRGRQDASPSCLRPIVLGAHADDDRIAGLQTPGGCGALRLGFELIAPPIPRRACHVGAPTWPNHPPIIKAAGLELVDYPYYERGQGASASRT